MAILANRVKTKNDLLELGRFLISSLKRFFIVILIAACFYLLYFPMNKLSGSVLEMSGNLLSVSSAINDVLIKNTKWIYEKLSYFKNLEAENIKLKLQLAELSQRIDLANKIFLENKELKKLLNVVENSKHAYLTSRLLGVNVTPFSSSAIIEAGEKENIKINDLVTNNNVLIGRITDVGDNYSSVKLLSDPSSRVPVVTANSKERAILSKQDDEMHLIYLSEEHNVRPGEIIYTSGDGKIYPYGLVVGMVYKVDSKGVFVKLSGNTNNIEFVNVELGFNQDDSI